MLGSRGRGFHLLYCSAVPYRTTPHCKNIELTACCVCCVLCVLQERSTSSNWQTAFNAINVLCGVGLLTTPYAMAISGTSALLLLVLIGTLAPGQPSQLNPAGAASPLLTVFSLTQRPPLTSVEVATLRIALLQQSLCNVCHTVTLWYG